MMLNLDGSFGEGGGQILRTALGLAMATRTSFFMQRIRARRRRPGLRPQHLAAVNAAARVCNATTKGATPGSQELRFEPGSVAAADYEFSVGTAGSATLVLQALLPGLLAADKPSRVVVEGGTHNPQAPPFEFLARAFLPLVNRMGPRVDARLERRGFFPAGGGRIRLEVAPAPWRPLRLEERGRLVARRARALVANLPLHIAERELKRVGWEDAHAESVEATGPGNVLLLEVEHEHSTEVVTGFGEKGVPAEKVAGRALAEMERYLAADGAVGEHLADQLLVPMALAGGGSFTTLPLTLHAHTNIAIIQRFLDVEAEVTPAGTGAERVVMAKR